MNIQKQIENGLIVCPRTYQELKKVNENLLQSKDALNSYPIVNGVPVLFHDPVLLSNYIKDSEMVEKYSEKNRFIDKLIPRLEKNILSDLRTSDSREAMKMFDSLDETQIAIAIGGGPKRHHPKLQNLNISTFKNVDVVADAHFLPYKDESVDIIHCDSVIEHLYDPNKAVLEMFRVLKKGGKVFAITPFLQPYHGYPFHYQNLTITGHKRLFESKGFSIINSGTCVGPTYALILLNATYLNKYLPSLLKIFAYLYAIMGFGVIKYLDKWVNRKENSHFLASSTFIVAQK